MTVDNVKIVQVTKEEKKIAKKLIAIIKVLEESSGKTLDIFDFLCEIIKEPHYDEYNNILFQEEE